MRCGVLVLVPILLLPASAGRAQQLPPASSFPRQRPLGWPPSSAALQAESGVGPGAAFLASAILPGAGQYLLGAERWVPYLVLEAWAGISYLDRRADARALERTYRDLAWVVPRRLSESPLRRDTTFEYYELLAQYDASGLFDMDEQLSGVQPERDETTYNGAVWRLARSLYLPGGVLFPVDSPEYQRALAHYVQNAIPSSYYWAWGESDLEQQAYVELIQRSDDAYRAATQLLGLMVANHVVSAVDALVTARVRRARGEAPRLRLRGAPQRLGRDSRWAYWVQVSW
jgi:hypothetical protein